MKNICEYKDNTGMPYWVRATDKGTADAYAAVQGWFLRDSRHPKVGNDRFISERQIDVELE